MPRPLALLAVLSLSMAAFAQTRPLRLGVAGLTHTHVHWLLGRPDRGDVEIVGIAEPNRPLARRYTEQHGLSMDIVYSSLEEMIAATAPEAVAAFGTIREHVDVVEACAPRGIHVMVEKPLATDLPDAERMAALAREHGVALLTNYETTWYPSVDRAAALVDSGAIGALRKAVVRDGHRGPRAIGVNEEFLAWLTDPAEAGAGALTDFGCYGANLATWLLGGARPRSVTALTQQLQPGEYPAVDDDATILLAYDSLNVTIQASWNWPIGRKDLELYGTTGVLLADDGQTLRLREAVGYDGYDETTVALAPQPAPRDDPFALLAAVVRGELTLEPHDRSALENNLLVVAILDAARRSAAEGVRVELGE